MVNYIRNKDRAKFPVSKLSKDKGIILSRFKGTIAEAKRKDVPVFNPNGTIKKGSVGYKEQKAYLRSRK